MQKGMRSIYRQYVDYVNSLAADLERTGGAPLTPEYRPQPVAFAVFADLWRRWSETPGLQEAWRARFELGYAEVASELRARTVAALSSRKAAPQSAA